MERITAADLRLILSEKEGDEYSALVEKFKEEAMKGGASYYVEKPLRPLTLRMLEEDGYTIIHGTSMDIMKQSLYYTIRW